MFRTVPLSIIKCFALYTPAMLYVRQVCWQLWAGSGCNWFHPTVKNSWWWTEELSETCRVLCQNKFEKLVHLVGFIIRIAYFIFVSKNFALSLIGQVHVHTFFCCKKFDTFIYCMTLTLFSPCCCLKCLSLLCNIMWYFFFRQDILVMFKYCRISFCDGLFHDDSLLQP